MEATLHRSARIAIRATRAQRRRLYGLLRSAGDVRALVLDCNRQLREWKLPPVVSYQALCREIAGMSFGELDMVGARSVIRRYSTEWIEAAKRRKAGLPVGFPRRKKALLAVRWYHGTFRIDGDRLRLPVARGALPLVARLAREIPYPAESIRSLTLVAEAGRLYVDVTAALSPEAHDLDPGIVAGHLADTRARAKRMGRKAPSRGQRGSRRWRKLRRTQRRREARHRRRIRQAHHEAAKAVVTWAVDHRVGMLRVGDPEGICNRDAGRRQNLRLRRWGRTHLIAALKDKAAMAGIELVEVDERGTSSTCLMCRRRVPKPRGRVFRCTSCGFSGHRDLVGAANIAARGGGVICGSPRIEHRRVGQVPTRRDRRRHRHDERRSCLAHGRRGSQGSRSRSPRGAERKGHPSVSRTRAETPAIGEEPLTGVLLQEGKG
ncbi:MAG: IS200/IS605 family element transposase accessory protein TnpB [Actinobacteria bacterium]|nr:MAG: IS200/IS605 family element transposase accessory protein TnpB [Actinomycetota bacterium]